jgi:outer membrane biosynthesis protein TonB
MRKALTISVIVHLLLVAALYWSTQISLLLMQAKRKEIAGGAIQVDLLYKPTETAMRRGKKKRDLPPPKVKRKKEAPRPVLVKKQPPKPKKQAKPEQSKEPKKDFKALFDKMREETGLDRNKAPREDNFPTREDGQKDAFGTGGSSEKELTPAQLALQAACRKHHRIPQAERMRKAYPDARGYINVRLIGAGTQLRIVSLNLVERSGFDVLDSACEAAVRKAIQEETFASDIVAELSGRENTITCQF